MFENERLKFALKFEDLEHGWFPVKENRGQHVGSATNGTGSHRRSARTLPNLSLQILLQIASKRFSPVFTSTMIILRVRFNSFVL